MIGIGRALGAVVLIILIVVSVGSIRIGGNSNVTVQSAGPAIPINANASDPGQN